MRPEKMAMNPYPSANDITLSSQTLPENPLFAAMVLAHLGVKHAQATQQKGEMSDMEAVCCACV